MLPSSQVKTENLIFHKLNLEIIVRLIKPTTHYHWSPRDPIANPSHDDDGGDDDGDGDDDDDDDVVTQGPNRQSTTPTSCTPSTTRSTHSCIRPRPRNNQSSVLFFLLFFLLFNTFFDILFDV